MYNYFGIEPYSQKLTAESFWAWKRHHNSIVVLRNPLDRVVSALKNTEFYEKNKSGGEWDVATFFYYHSYPYITGMLVGRNFRIIDFYDLEKYIPRRSDKYQSLRTYSHVDNMTKVEDVYVENEFYTLHALQREVDAYNKLMANTERVTVEEWKELTQ
jgi:hypothetical protein